jgi:hypothetical protein
VDPWGTTTVRELREVTIPTRTEPTASSIAGALAFVREDERVVRLRGEVAESRIFGE